MEAGGKALPGEVSAFSIDHKTGKLTSLNRVPSRGGQPCHICTDRTGKMAMVANWSTGSTAAFPIGRHGELGESTAFSQHEGPRSGEAAPGPQGAAPQIHCHSVVVTHDNRFLLSTDTGLNKVYVYRLDPAKAAFTPHDPPFLGLQKPTNPRHLALHRNAKWAYVANEINPGGCTMLRFDAARGVLEEGPVAASVPADYKGRTSPAECVVHPSGRFVYESNRGPNSITVFRVDQGDGGLTLVESFLPGGETPRSFAIDPTGAFLIAMMQRNGTIIPLRIDLETGKLAAAGAVLKLPVPVCAQFLAT
jgi:6-phosphogluconolactonase